MDAAPAGIASRVAKVISGVPGVLKHDRIRVRQSGNRLFMDLDLMLQSNIPLEHAQAVEDVVESKVRELFPGADIVIHSTPQKPSAGNLVEKIRSVAHRNNFQIHDVTPLEVKGKVNLNLDLELEPSLTLEAAHRKATELETEIKREIPEVHEVNVHIEPMRNRVERAREAAWLQEGMEKKLLAIAKKTPGLLDCHALVVHQVEDGIVVSIHCTLDSAKSFHRSSRSAFTLSRAAKTSVLPCLMIYSGGQIITPLTIPLLLLERRGIFSLG